MSDEQTLPGVDLFAGLSVQERREIARHCRWRRYDAGQEIIAYASRSAEVYFVVGGRVRATLFDATGTAVTFSDEGPGKVFGDLAALDDGPRSVAVVALEQTMAISMSASAFREVLLRHPEIALLELRLLAARVRMLTERVVEFSTLGVDRRIRAELLRRARLDGRDRNAASIEPAPLHAELASRVSTHREAVTKEINRLKRGGVIAVHHGVLRILDVTRLQALVREKAR